MEEITVGTTVRSFDFVGNREVYGLRACFVEGEVVDFRKVEGCDRYVIRVTRRVFGGVEQEDFSQQVIPPVNGTPTLFGGVTDGVEALSEGR